MLGLHTANSLAVHEPTISQSEGIAPHVQSSSSFTVANVDSYQVTGAEQVINDFYWTCLV